MDKIDAKRVLLDVLTTIQTNGPTNVELGLCLNITDQLIGTPREEMDLIRTLNNDLCEMWPEFSGNRVYPISVSELDPEDQYDAILFENLSMWDKDCEYCQARWRLLTWLISELERQITLYEVRVNMLSALKRIKANGPQNPKAGLCTALDMETDWLKIAALSEQVTMRSVRNGLFERWPEFSGDICYPIVDKNMDLIAPQQYFWSLRLNATWDKGGTYGQLRWRLVDWMIEQLESEISEDEHQH